MDYNTIQALIQVSAFEAEMQGMIAENKDREIAGLTMAYSSKDFQYISDEIRKISEDLSKKNCVK